MINKPTHFKNVSPSWIDLIFVSNTSYLTTGIEQLIYDKCHHNIIYGKLNFYIPLLLPYYSIVIRNGKIVWKHGPNRPFLLCNLSSENF